MKSKYLFLIVFCFILVFSCFNPIDPNATSGTLVFQGVAELPDLTKPLTDETVTDIDGNEYSTISVGRKVWMAENLRVTHYRNGDPIFHATDSIEWTEGTNGEYCYYGHDSTKVDTFGCLYNGYAVLDERGLAPEGWHVATDEDWKELEMAVGMSYEDANSSGFRGDVAGKLKSTFGWLPDTSGVDRNGTDDIGFTAVPGGYTLNGVFDHLGFDASFWTSYSMEVSDTLYVGYRDMHADRNTIRRMAGHAHTGMSVRCVRDSLVEGSDDRYEMTGAAFNIYEMYISQSLVSDGVTDDFDWQLICEDQGLVEMEDVNFMADSIPAGEYKSLKIVFRSHFVRYARSTSDTTETIMFESDLGESGEPDPTTFAINYFSSGGSFYSDSVGTFHNMSEGENMPSFNINAGRTTTIYWKGGGPETKWTDLSFEWQDYNMDGEWTPGVDELNNWEEPDGIPMWTFMVVEE